MSTKFVIDTEEILKKIKEKKQLNENENVQFSHNQDYEQEKDPVYKYKISHPQLFAKFVEQFPDFEATYEQTKQKISNEKDPKKRKELEGIKERQLDFFRLRKLEILEKEKAVKKQNVQQQPVEQKPQEEISPIETHYKRFENMYGINVNVIVKILKDLETYCLKNKKMYESKGLSVYASNMQNVHFLMSLLSGGISKMLMNNESTSEESANNFSNFTNLVASVAKDVGVEQKDTQDSEDDGSLGNNAEDKRNVETQETPKREEKWVELDPPDSPKPEAPKPSSNNIVLDDSKPEAPKKYAQLDKRYVGNFENPKPVVDKFKEDRFIFQPNSSKPVQSKQAPVQQQAIDTSPTQNAESPVAQQPIMQPDQQIQSAEPVVKQKSPKKDRTSKVLQQRAKNIIDLFERSETGDALLEFSKINNPKDIEQIKTIFDNTEGTFETFEDRLFKSLKELKKDDEEIKNRINVKRQIFNFIQSFRMKPGDNFKSKFKASIPANQLRPYEEENNQNKELNQKFDEYMDSLAESENIKTPDNPEESVVQEIRQFVKNFLRREV